MQNRVEKATGLFKQTFNCSQSIFTAFRDEANVDEKTALKLSTVFGAGVACTGKSLCGAASGALMAISMKYGRDDVKDTEARQKTYELGAKFLDDFKKKNGSYICKELLGVDIGTREGMAKFKQEKMVETKCANIVKSTAEKLEELL
jgi:C_GCAxxG_C_C family probable redox protein